MKFIPRKKKKHLGLTDILREVKKHTASQKLTMGDLVDALDNRGFGPLLLAPQLLILLPTGALPGVPTLSGVLIILIAGQIVLGYKHPWLPRKIREQAVSKPKFNAAYKKITPYTQKIDKLFKPRLNMFASPCVIRFIAGLFVLMSLMFPVLEFIPFTSDGPAVVMTFFALGISTNDGLLILLGFLLAFVGLPLFLLWLI